MHLLFIIIAACLVLLALLFILPPLWRPTTNIKTATDERNIEIAKQRLAELKDQLQAGDLTQTQFDEQRAELELVLSDDLTLKTNPLNIGSQGRGLSIFLLVAVPIVAVSLYAVLGNFSAVNPTPEMMTSNQPKLPDRATINKMVEGLAEKMKANPNDTQGWLMLGKSYKYLEQYDKAANAFGNAYKLLGDKPDVMLAYAEALAFANQKQINEKSAELIFKVLNIEPNNAHALWLAGMAKTQTGEFQEAKALWTKLANTMQQGSEEHKAMQDLLSNVDKKIAESANGLQVQVSLAAELKADANDTVFIYAQAENSKMPLAIVRKTVRELPVSVVLSDALAMTPDNKLSNFKTVKLLARVSKSGNPVPQSGDLIGTVEQISVNDKKPHTLIINTTIK